jgi:hypothetical protein
MTTPFENFVNIALGKSLSADVTLPTADDIPVFTGIGRQVTGKTIAELGIALTADLDSAVTKVWKDQGNYDVSGGTAWPTSANTIGELAIKAGNLWVVTGAATNGTTLTGGKIVSNGDTIRALIDDATNAGADWGVNEANLGYTPENQNNKDTDGTLAANSDTKYPSQKAVKTYADTKQAALADVVTAGDYGSSTQVPVITFNAKGIATTVTLATIGAPVLTEANFSVAKTGEPTYTVSWVLTALTDTRAWTVPDKAINLGDLPSIATTNFNNLSGTRNRILGGSSNTVSGTDNVVVTGSNNTLSASGQVVITGDFIEEVTWNCAVVTAAMADSATYRKTVSVTTAMMGATFWGTHINGACTTGGAYTATTVPKSYLSIYADIGGTATFSTIGIHTLTIIGRTANTAGSTINSGYRFAGKRRVVVNYTGGIVTVDITTEGTDYNPAGAVIMDITNDAGKLMIAPFFTTEVASETSSVWNVLVESVYTTL